MKFKPILALSIALSACSAKPTMVNNTRSEIRDIRDSLNFSDYVNNEKRTQCNEIPGFLKDFLIENRVIIRRDFEKSKGLELQYDLETRPVLILNASINQDKFRPVSSYNIYLDESTNCIDETLRYYVQNQDFNSNNLEKLLVINSQSSFNQTERFDELVLKYVSYVLNTIDLVGERGRVNDENFPPELLFNFLSSLENIHHVMHSFQVHNENLLIEINNNDYQSEIKMLTSSLYTLNSVVSFVLNNGETPQFQTEFESARRNFESEYRFSLSCSSYEFIITNAMKFLINPESLNHADFRFGFHPNVINFVKEKYSDFRDLP